MRSKLIMSNSATAISPAPSSGSPRRLPGVVWATGWVSLLTDMSTELIYAVLPAFYQTVLGLNVFQQGLVEGVAEAIASVTKLFSGHWSDRTGGRKWWMVAGYGLSSLSKPLLVLPGLNVGGAVGLRAADRFGKGIRGAPRDALISLSIDKSQRGHAFGINRAMDHFGAMAGALIAGTLLLFGWTNLHHLFYWTLLPGGAAVLVILIFIRDPRSGVPDSAAGKPPAPALTPISIAQAWAHQPPSFRRFLAVLAVFSLGNSTDALLLLRARQQMTAGGWSAAVATACLPFLWALLHVFKSASSAWAGRLSDRIGRRGPLQTAWFIYALVYLGFAIPFAGTISVAVPWVLFAVYGFYFGLAEGPQGALVADLCRRGQERGTAYGLYHFIVGISALPASLLCGGLWWALDKVHPGLGPLMAFGTGATLALAAALLLPWSLRRA